jgi:hypothetical protein
MMKGRVNKLTDELPSDQVPLGLIHQEVNWNLQERNGVGASEKPEEQFWQEQERIGSSMAGNSHIM